MIIISYHAARELTNDIRALETVMCLKIQSKCKTKSTHMEEAMRSESESTFKCIINLVACVGVLLFRKLFYKSSRFGH
jgi:hypothetical protein